MIEDGNFPISVAHVGGWGEGRRPFPTVHTAKCYRCDEWATDYRAGFKVYTDEPYDREVVRGASIYVERKIEMVLFYVCDEHGPTATDELMSEELDFGTATCAPNLQDAFRVTKEMDEIAERERQLHITRYYIEHPEER